MDELLKLIETVDPSDTAKLDEIDARVFCFQKHIEFEEKRLVWVGHEHNKQWEYFMPPGNPQFMRHSETIAKVTRSRDALKAIRPQGWVIRLIETHNIPTSFRFEIYQYEGDAGRSSPTLLTEELAELHAIIQAIEHERGVTQKISELLAQSDEEMKNLEWKQ